jgi:hypothetical protein
MTYTERITVKQSKYTVIPLLNYVPCREIFLHVTKLQAMKMYGGINPLILNLGTRWK